MTCTCPFIAACWHGDVCMARGEITDRPGCFRPLDGRTPVVEPVPTPPKPLTGGAEALYDEGPTKEARNAFRESLEAVCIQGVLF